ncbi:hypothetical protein O181_069752 [Austropuccinia psidii MF-1]|uniref:Aminomethyltransferase n=1 Tax=Austropuccinia psidii MF-1 TaxID=1389203 RepID=A0A9Q3I7L1_9BASI|nr:hypothetical protein [Austropuccinia psidii MF-1]
MLSLRNRLNLLNKSSFQLKKNNFKTLAKNFNDQQLKFTPLYNSIHKKFENGSKLVEFANFHTPLSYAKSGGQIAEHLSVRKECGLFDVSHMVQTKISGKKSTEFLSILLPTSLSTMRPFTSSLSVIMNEKGGIIDDCMITKWSSEDYYLVTNASRQDRDTSWIKSLLSSFSFKDQVSIESLDGSALVALQGPKAAKILQNLIDDPSYQLDRSLFFSQSVFTHLAGSQVHIARTGYTGEDGFEISIKPQDAVKVADAIASQPGVTLAGLAARDSLRLEAGLCLYGADLDESVGVAEAGLSWVVGKERSGFIGEERTRTEKGDLIQRRRVGLIVEKGPPARSGSKIISSTDGQELGQVTSGIPSPSLENQNIAMGYVKSGHHKPGTQLQVLVRGKPRTAEVVKMPFVSSNYYRAPK